MRECLVIPFQAIQQVAKMEMRVGVPLVGLDDRPVFGDGFVELDHLSYLYEEMKEFDKAIAEYRTIIQADERYSDAHLHLGYLLYRLKGNDEALLHVRE